MPTSRGKGLTEQQGSSPPLQRYCTQSATVMSACNSVPKAKCMGDPTRGFHLWRRGRLGAHRGRAGQRVARMAPVAPNWVKDVRLFIRKLKCQGSGEQIALSSPELIRSFGPGEPDDFRLSELALLLA